MKGIIIMNQFCRTSLLLIACSLLIVVDGQQQDQPPNFEGSFDSLNTYEDNQHDAGAREGEEGEDGEEEYEEEEDILEFSENLGDFIPHQTFTFKLPISGQETFMVWPEPNVASIRGMFHCQVDWGQDEDESGGYVDLTIMDGPNIVREYKQQRLGVFKHTPQSQNNKFKFIFRRNLAPVEVYFSYECSTLAKAADKSGDNVTELSKVVTSFERVNSLLQQQEHQMKRLMEIGSSHTSHLEYHLRQLWWRAVIEACALLGSAVASLLMLKTQINNGYQSLV